MSVSRVSGKKGNWNGSWTIPGFPKPWFMRSKERFRGLSTGLTIFILEKLKSAGLGSIILLIRTYQAQSASDSSIPFYVISRIRTASALWNGQKNTTQWLHSIVATFSLISAQSTFLPGYSIPSLIFRTFRMCMKRRFKFPIPEIFRVENFIFPMSL